MAIEDTFNGAKNAFVFHQAFVNTVAEDIGIERVTALTTKMGEALGVVQGGMAKAQAEQAGMKDFDATAAHLVCNQPVAGLGITTEVTEQGAQEVVYQVGRCPIFEAAQLMGQDIQTSEAGCVREQSSSWTQW